ncbi:hypothetical protein BVX99_03535 [bacterium F16]|nr:hypothetical protein BVX99_03535 [bacterium F16]
MKFLLTTGLCVMLTACSTRYHRDYPSYKAAISREAPVIFNDQEIRLDANEKVDALFAGDSEFTPHSALLKQLSRRTCQLDVVPTGHQRLTPTEIYQQRITSVVMVGSVYRCNRKTCKKNHFNPASGVIIHKDGVVVTNYHVVEARTTPTMIAIAVRTFDGRVFSVEEVLAADKTNDVAVLKLKGSKDLAAAPIFNDEPVGQSVTLIAHPVGRFYTLTRGYISRYFITQKNRVAMGITADYAKGASGGPIFNDRGDVVGLVSSTRSVPYTSVPLSADPETGALQIMEKGGEPVTVDDQNIILGLNHQMTFKQAVPSRCIMNLIRN